MNNVGEKFLPLGTVVMLKGASKRLMITGFCTMAAEDENSVMYDYAGCMYPEGMISSDQNALFNHDQIDQIYHMGLVDQEERDFKTKLNQLLSASVAPVESAPQPVVEPSFVAPTEVPVSPVGPGLPGYVAPVAPTPVAPAEVPVPPVGPGLPGYVAPVAPTPVAPTEVPVPPVGPGLPGYVAPVAPTPVAPAEVPVPPVGPGLPGFTAPTAPITNEFGFDTVGNPFAAPSVLPTDDTETTPDGGGQPNFQFDENGVLISS